MITPDQITEILFNSLTVKEKELVNCVTFCLIKIGIKRKTSKMSRDIISAVMDYNRNKKD